MSRMSSGDESRQIAKRAALLLVAICFLLSLAPSGDLDDSPDSFDTDDFLLGDTPLALRLALVQDPPRAALSAARAVFSSPIPRPPVL